MSNQPGFSTADDHRQQLLDGHAAEGRIPSNKRAALDPAYQEVASSKTDEQASSASARQSQRSRRPQQDSDIASSEGSHNLKGSQINETMDTLSENSSGRKMVSSRRVKRMPPAPQQKPKKREGQSTLKLKQKQLSIKTANLEENEEDKKQFEARYYHISVDKLADAFQKQFIQDLPEFGLYSKNDVDTTPEAQEEKINKFGIKSLAQSTNVIEKEQPLLGPSKPAVASVKNSVASTQHKSPSSTGHLETPFSQAQKQQELRLTQQVKLQNILTQQSEHLQISIFKHKADFYILRKSIDSDAYGLIVLNYVIAIVLGIFPIAFFIVNVFMNKPNFYILLAMRLQTNYHKDAEAENLTSRLSIFVDATSLLIGILYVSWVVYSTRHFKSKKVSIVGQLPKLAYMLIIIYSLIFLGNLFLSTMYIVEYVGYQEGAVKYEQTPLMESFYIIKVVFLLLYAILMFFYLRRLNRYITSMKKFHSFLNNYRLTPKSRFIRKYKPSLEPLYEEQSAFEMSHRSSQTTEQLMRLSQSLFNTSNNQKFNLASSQSNVENTSAAGSKRSYPIIKQSMAGGQSSINFDERNNRFNEVLEDEEDPQDMSNHFIDMGYDGESKMDHLNTSGLEFGDEKSIPAELRMYSDNQAPAPSGGFLNISMSNSPSEVKTPGSGQKQGELPPAGQESGKKKQYFPGLNSSNLGQSSNRRTASQTVEGENLAGSNKDDLPFFAGQVSSSNQINSREEAKEQDEDNILRLKSEVPQAQPEQTFTGSGDTFKLTRSAVEDKTCSFGKKP